MKSHFSDVTAKITTIITHTHTHTGSLNINRIFFSAETSARNRIALLVVREGISITVKTYQYVSTCFLSALIMMSEQVVPSAVVQCISVNFLTNENVKPAEILKSLSTVR
jgi:hypothetical protein